MIYKQSLRAEEAYLGFSEKDPLSNSSSHMVLKSYWPNHSSAELTVDFEGQFAIIFSDRFFLKYHMPYQFDQARGNAKFVADKQTLELTLPVKNRNSFGIN